MKCSGVNCPMQYPYDEKNCSCVDTCPYATKIPYTNAERIRAMSDEEMETELLPLFEELCEDGIPSTDYMRFWLQQPAEEEP